MIGLTKNIPVLMYHQIDQPETHSSLVVSRESFLQQVHWLRKKNFRFFSLEEIVRKKGKTLLTDRSVALTFDDGFLDNYENLMSLSFIPAAIFVVVNWVGQKGFMIWEQIRELAERGVTIGSHALTHRWLPSIEDDSELEREVVDSKKKIEDEIGREVRWFSYPVGGTDERVAQYVQKAGYQAAWVAGAKPSLPIKDPLFCLRRVKVSPSDISLLHFAIKAYGMKSFFY